MTIDQNRATAFDMGVAGGYDRVLGSFMNLGIQAHGSQFSQEPFRACPDIPGVAGIGGNARKSKERKQILKFGGHLTMLAA
jgi:hypothetical protein